MYSAKQSKTLANSDWWKTTAIALVALAGIVALQFYGLRSINRGKEDPKAAEKQEALRLQLLKKTPTFGYDNLIADWTFLKFLQYFGDDPARDKIGYSLSQDYFDIVTKLDPRWVDIYLFLTNALSIYEAKPKLSVEYTTRGTNALSPEIDPKAWQLWRFKGIDQILFLGDTKGAIYSHEMAADWVANTPDRDFAPLFKDTAQFLKTDPDNKLIRFNAWLWIYYQSFDEKVKERAKKELIALGAKVEEGIDGTLRFSLPEAQQKK
jgi:hypothetical protein